MTGSPRSTHVAGETVAGSANAGPVRGGGSVVDDVVVDGSDDGPDRGPAGADGSRGADGTATGAASAGDGAWAWLVPTPTRKATTRKTRTAAAHRRRPVGAVGGGSAFG